MNKTYIANENHPFLKDGVRLETVPNQGWYVFTEDSVHKLDWADTPSNMPHWYDEVRWKPKEMEEYFRLDSISYIGRAYWTNSSVDQDRYKIGNCYQTSEEAEQARERVLKAYKGE